MKTFSSLNFSKKKKGIVEAQREEIPRKRMRRLRTDENPYKDLERIRQSEKV